MMCPYCGSEMVRGKLLGDRFKLKWIPDGETLIFRSWVRPNKNAIVLKDKSDGFGRPYAEAFVCKTCKKMTIDF